MALARPRVAGRLRRRSPPRRRPRPRADLRFGAAPAPVAPHLLAGYPAPHRHLLTAEAVRAARRELSARVPGWHVEQVDADGFPLRVAGPLPADATTPEAARRVVGDLLAALAADYGVTTRPVITDGATGPMVAFDPPAVEDPIIHVSTGPQPDPWWLAIDAQPGAAPLPPGVTERTDAELVATWGPDPGSRSIRVSRYHEGHPCDLAPGYPHACDGAGPRTEVTCEPVPADPVLVRGVLPTTEGVRRIAVWRRVLSDSMRSGGAIETTLPTCWDAVTGEVLPANTCRFVRLADGSSPYR